MHAPPSCTTRPCGATPTSSRHSSARGDRTAISEGDSTTPSPMRATREKTCAQKQPRANTLRIERSAFVCAPRATTPGNHFVFCPTLPFAPCTGKTRRDTIQERREATGQDTLFVAEATLNAHAAYIHAGVGRLATQGANIMAIVFGHCPYICSGTDDAALQTHDLHESRVFIVAMSATISHAATEA